jgi:hypothetical protein
MLVIVWYLDLQLPVQSVPITTKVVSSNHVHGEMYSICNIMWKSLSVTCDSSFFPPGTLVSSINKTEILLKVALNTINQPTNQILWTFIGEDF